MPLSICSQLLLLPHQEMSYGWRQGLIPPTSFPNSGRADREKHFSLKNGVTIYGGFNGTETSQGERDAGVNITILSGDIGKFFF